MHVYFPCILVKSSTVRPLALGLEKSSCLTVRSAGPCQGCSLLGVCGGRDRSGLEGVAVHRQGTERLPSLPSP
jgi:hypothetical protein